MSLRIGLDIYEALTARPLPGGAEGRVLPLLAPNGAVEKPLVTYRSAAVAGEYTKDGCYDDRGTVEVSCLASTYREAVELAVAVRLRLTECPGVGIEAQLTGAEDRFALDADAFVVELSFLVRSRPDTTDGEVGQP